MLPQAQCGPQESCVCPGMCSRCHELLEMEEVLVLLLTVSSALSSFSRMEVMRLTSLQGCVWRSVNGKSQWSLQPESEASIALDFLM